MIQNVYGGGDDIYGANNGIELLAPAAEPTAYKASYTITAPPARWADPPSPAWAAPTTGYGSKLPLLAIFMWEGL